MPDRFNMQVPPFRMLSQQEQKHLLNQLDIAYFHQQQVILYSGQSSEYLFIILKGHVAEIKSNIREVCTHFKNNDLFCIGALFEQKVCHDHIALEDTLCYLLPKASFLDFHQHNQDFAAYFSKICI